NELHRVDELEEHVPEQVVPEAVTVDPHEREAREQRNGEQDEEAPPTEMPPEARAVESVGDIADDGREERIEQACTDVDVARFAGRESTERGEEEQRPGRHDEHD